MNANPTTHRRGPIRSSRIRQRQTGFTLLEVLVAMLVLAIGLLGVAAMQLRGMKYSHDAYLRSQISVLAYDMADRMRLNAAAAASYTGDYTIPTTAPAGCTVSAVSPANDLACWRLQAFRALPPGSEANISVESVTLGGVAVDEYTIELQWTDRDGDDRNIQYKFQP